MPILKLVLLISFLVVEWLLIMNVLRTDGVVMAIALALVLTIMGKYISYRVSKRKAS